MQIILASGSPRRKEFLQSLGLEFKTVVPGVKETLQLGESPTDFALRLSEEKARSVEAKPNEIVLAADTIVVFEDQIFGKPVDKEDATRMLLAMSGKSHEVMTGFSVVCGERVIKKLVKTKISLRTITLAEVKPYVETDEPYDKSGAFGIQGAAATFIDRVEGSLTNVMGLPVREVLEALDAFRK